MEANKDIDEQNSRPYILISDMVIIASEPSNELLRSSLRKKMTDDEKSYYDKNSTTIKTIMNNIMLEQIHQFFDEFIVKISQSDTAQLRNLIYEEIRSETGIANLEVHSMLRGKMIDWLADKSLCVLMPNKFNEFVTAPENDARRFFLLKYTQSFISEYDELVQGHKINTSKIEIEIEALKNFLINTNRNDLVMLLYGVGVKLRIYWTLKSMDNYSKLDEWSFLEISFKSMMQGMLPKILQGVTLKFVIIDCRLQNKSPSEVLVLLEKVLHAAFTNNKKIILIIKADDQKEYRDKISDMDRNLEADSDSKPLNIVNEELKELSSNKLKLLYENHNEKYMYLAGKNYLLFKILQDESSNLYEFIADVDNITAVMKELNEQKFEHPLASRLPYKVYLKNQIIKMIPIYALRNVLETKDLSLLIFECKVDFERLEKLLNGWFNFEERKQFTSKIREARQNSDIIYILSRQTCDIDSTLLYTPKKKRVMIYVGDFNSLTGEHKDLNHIVVKLKNPNKLNKNHKWSINKENNTDTIKLGIIGRIPVFITDYSKELQLPPASEYINQYEEEYSLPTILPKNNNFVILSADAGFGKTALLINRINEWAGDENLESILSWKLYVHLPSQRFDDFQDLQTFVKKLVRDFTLKDWQLKALLNDMEKEDRVELLFDGLDEIKDENKIITFNKLLTEISDTTAIVITTRPYAAYKVDKPIKRNLGLYLTLARYTDEQRDKYIKMMIPKILNEGAMHSFMRDTRMTEKKIAKIANNLCEHIDQEISKKVQHLIGIPLECYIFCETKASKIIIYGTDCIDNGDEAQEEKSLKSTSGLYREFLFTKLKVFTERYLNISLNNDLKDRSRIYNVSSNYIIILAVLAFKQAFQLSSNFVHSALARSYFTKEMLSKLKHTGLVTVSKHADEDFAGGGRCLSLNFNHATYQEYLAALYLLYGLILDDELRSIVQCQIKNNRYNPSYALILSLAAQLSIDEIEVIPGFAADKHAILFWKALCDEADILGAAESKLLQKCLYEFSDKMVTTLIKIVNGTSCYKKIKKELGKRSKKYLRELEEFIITDQSNIPQPMIFDDSKSETESLSTVENSDINILKNKNRVIEFTNDLLQSKGSDYVARAFEIIIKEKIKSDHDKVKSEDYWGMDGGFEAMALLGDSFNNCHAQYFIKRVDNYPEHRWSKACNAVESLLKYCTKPNVKAECVNLIECLAKHALEYDSPERLIPLIRAVRSEVFLSFSQLEDQIRELPEYSIPNEIHGRPYQQFILKFTFALWISIKMTYAVIKSKDTHEIIIKEEKAKKIKIDRDKVHVWNLIENVIDELAEHPDEDSKARLLINTKRWKCLIYEDLVKTAIENKDYSVLHDETFIDIVVKDYHIVANILKIYHKQKLINDKVAERLLAFIDIIKDIKSIQWPIKGGIEAITYTGKYFNQEFANFLRTRANWYKNNRQKASASLQGLAQILQNCNDETCRDAVDAYNWCLNVIK